MQKIIFAQRAPSRGAQGMLSPTTLTPASTVKLWPVFVGLTVTFEKFPVI